MRYYLWLLLFISYRIFAWGTTGHLIVAQIAYQHLTPKAHTQVDRLSKLFTRNYPQFKNFQMGSDWADSLRNNGVSAFNAWHFINQPLSYVQHRQHYYAKHNVVWAILQSEQVLKSPRAAPMSKAMFLMFLAHFVADAHQPLHCVNFYSKRFPRGDRGGTLFLINTSWASNLHQYWDMGGDFFWHYRRTNALSTYGIQALANKIQEDYPENYFAAKAKNLNPQDWAEESYLIAKNFAYHIKFNSKPKQSYQIKTQKISEQRIALAG